MLDSNTGSLSESHLKILWLLRQKSYVVLATTQTMDIQSRGMVDKPVSYTHYNSSSISLK
jgi:hypothetical protein